MQCQPSFISSLIVSVLHSWNRMCQQWRAYCIVETECVSRLSVKSEIPWKLGWNLFSRALMHSFQSIKFYAIFSTIHRKVLLTKYRFLLLGGDGLLDSGRLCPKHHRSAAKGCQVHSWLELPYRTRLVQRRKKLALSLEKACFVSSHFYPATLPAWLALSLVCPLLGGSSSILLQKEIYWTLHYTLFSTTLGIGIDRNVSNSLL